MKLFKRSSALLVISSFFVLTACGNDQGAPENDGEQLEGEVAIDGSSTVFPILEAVSEDYSMQQPGVRAPVGVSGTGGGFKRFVIGETDMNNASRPIKEEEIALMQENGIDYIELEVAYDGLSVAVSKENDFVDYLTVDELNRMWTDGNNIETWADVREGWPEEEIEFFSPGHDSGTYDYWHEVILQDADIRKDAQMSEDDNVLVNGVAGSKNGIGYFGYAYYIENSDKLKVVPVDNGDGPVEPSEETINSGEYAPLSRPMYVYVNVESLQKPEVLDYITFMNENVGELSLEVGYINMPQEKYDENTSKIEEALQ
ncbi:PstS family phosphate ABC transporter substrate-binding protein [Alkalihalobacillus deserti]|uniref:PstS family phosphate ABC transporter substrate-binding protein n=1 Tax=Alkalihalobacillus deserti TaxID=2879466 RepID=UPI001D14FFDC|nr:PstS family phosphate ABC transporter substrate-binding protein [Alkalihalobacillus deserti]